MFDQATREHLRFDSPRGPLSTEDLWDIPLETKNEREPSLDAICVALSNQLGKSEATKSFIKPGKGTAEKERIQLRFNIAKHILDVRLKELEDKAGAKERKDQEQLLLDILAGKENDQLRSLSVDELKKKIAELKASKAS